MPQLGESADPALRCSLCGEPIPPGSPYYSGIRGWEKPGFGMGGKSGSSIVLRVHTGEVACPQCVTSQQAGIHRGQMTLE